MIRLVSIATPQNETFIITLRHHLFGTVDLFSIQLLTGIRDNREKP